MLESLIVADAPAFGPIARIGPLSPVTMVFGANGSGKTTISRALEDPTRFGGAELHWAAGTDPCTIKVYNRDYVEAALQESAQLPGVFLVGEVDVEVQREIDSLDGPDGAIAKARALAERHRELRNLRSKELDVANGQLRDAVWQAKGSVRAALEPMFDGYRNSKEKTRLRVLEVAAEPSSDESFGVLEKEAAGIFDDSAQPLDRFPERATPSLELLAGFALLTTPVVGSSDVGIAPLIEQLGSADWVRHGQGYLEHTGGACPFCQQRLPAGLQAQMEAYFDSRYAEQTANLQALRQSVHEWSSGWETYFATFLDSVVVREHLDEPRFALAVESLRRALNSAIAAVDAKVAGPSSLHFISNPTQEIAEINAVVAEANRSIDAYNERIRNRGIVRRDIVRRSWNAFVHRELVGALAAYNAVVPALERAVNGLNHALLSTEKTTRIGERRLKELQARVTSSKPIIDRINRFLDAAGFHSFRIEESTKLRDGYVIRRESGEVASATLSEGERTFITFLYYAHSLEGMPGDDETKESVAVVDDPISSLDSDVLYVVVTLIRKIIEDIEGGNGRVRQLLLLTHNAYFHKEVAYNHHRRKVRFAFGVVRKNGPNPSSIRFGTENQVRTSYSSLWEEVRAAVDDPEGARFGLQNVLRRILETYFKVLGHSDPDDIVAGFSGPEQTICRSLFSWVNAGSHSIFDDLDYTHTSVTVDVQLQIFEAIFDKQGHRAHYEMMMRGTVGAGRTGALKESDLTPIA